MELLFLQMNNVMKVRSLLVVVLTEKLRMVGFVQMNLQFVLNVETDN